jgi:hypothetical protein
MGLLNGTEDTGRAERRLEPPAAIAVHTSFFPPCGFQVTLVRRLVSSPPAQAWAAMLCGRRRALHFRRGCFRAAGRVPEQADGAGEESSRDDRKKLSHVNLPCCSGLRAFVRRSRSQCVRLSTRCAPASAMRPSPRPHAAVVDVEIRQGRARGALYKEAKRRRSEDRRAFPNSFAVNARIEMQRAWSLFRRRARNRPSAPAFYLTCDVRRRFVSPAAGNPFTRDLQRTSCHRANESSQ